jgi:2-polyprenyl-3-methyl-5-hydroxy-6-metoxy-1,4-benzoquinol methylase
MNPHNDVDISDHTQRYWLYEYDVAARYMAPLLGRWGVTLTGHDVLDIGCGEGGGLCALHDAGARCAGFDIDEQRIQAGRQLKGNRTLRLTAGSIFDPRPPFADDRFDLVVLHDVFEHLDQKQAILRTLTDYLNPSGCIMITFPPYFSAFGAHQQHLSSPLLRLPFAHLVPGIVSRLTASAHRETPFVVEEVAKLMRLKMGLRAFERIAGEAGMVVRQRQGYLISPNHIRFGLRPVPAGPLVALPWLSEVLCSGVVYLLSPP